VRAQPRRTLPRRVVGALFLAAIACVVLAAPAAARTPAPKISSFSPTSGPAGTVVTVAGSNFTGATAVAFNRSPAASYTVVSGSQIRATVSAGATTGRISVTTPGGTANSAGNFTVIKAPTISGFSPTSGLAGTTVTISGANLTGATVVTFNGTSAASYTVVSASQITATAPSGAGSGPIAVTTPGGTATSTTSFTVTTPPPVPTITGFNPANGPAGTNVTITGSGFTGATAVAFNGTAAATYTVVSDSQLTATAPSGAGSGPITVTTPGGTATSTTSFTVTTPAATLHYAVNVGSDVAQAAALGFTMFDVSGSTSNPSGVNQAVNALPAGSMALIWAGSLDTTSCLAGFTLAQFQAQVDALKDNPRVFGYYVADEPHPGNCATAASDIKARADYIHANAPGQKAFIVVLDGSNQCGTNLGCEYNALAPANTDVDYVGLDPYPCHYDTSGNPVPCDLSKITQRVSSAESNGVPVADIVPVFQAFGQLGLTQPYYRMPTADELSSMLSLWATLVPSPPFDYFYTFGAQATSAPQAIINSPSIQPVVAAHNGTQ
jgi:hypothetical protein